MAARLSALLVRLAALERRREPVSVAVLRDAVMVLDAEFDDLARHVLVAERVAQEPEGCICGTGNETLESVTRRHCERAIRVYGVPQAAEVLGVPESTLYRWRKRWSAPAPGK